MGGVTNRDSGFAPSQGWEPKEDTIASKGGKAPESVEVETGLPEGVSLTKLAGEERRLQEKAASEEKALGNLMKTGMLIIDSIPEEGAPDATAQTLTSSLNIIAQDADEILEQTVDLRRTFENVDSLAQSTQGRGRELLQEVDYERHELEHVTTHLQEQYPTLDVDAIKSEMLGKLQKMNEKIDDADKGLKHVKTAVGELQNLIEDFASEEIGGEKLASERHQLGKILKGIKSYNKTESPHKKARHLKTVLKGLQKISQDIREQREGAQNIAEGVDRLDQAIGKIQKKIAKIENELSAAEALEKEFQQDVAEIKEKVEKAPKLKRTRKESLERHIDKLESAGSIRHKVLKEEREVVSQIGVELERGKKKVETLGARAEEFVQELARAEEIVDTAIELFERTEKILERIEKGEETSETAKATFEAVAKSAESAAAGQGAGAMGALVFLTSIPALALKGKAHHQLKKQNQEFQKTLKPIRELKVKLENQLKLHEEGSEEYISLQESIRKLDQKLNPLEFKVQELTKLQKKVKRGIGGDVGKAVISGFAAGALIAKEVIEAAETSHEGANVAEAAAQGASHAAAHAGIAAGVGMGLVGVLGMGLSTRGLYKNRKTSQALDSAVEETIRQLLQAQEEGNVALQNILLLRLSNLESQHQDNKVSAIKNALTFTSSLGGTAAGTMIVIAGGVATGVLGAAVLGTVIGAAVIGGIVLIGGVSYLIYKKRHAIAHGGRTAIIAIDQKIAKQQLKHATKNLEHTHAKVVEKGKLLQTAQDRSERKRIRSEIRQLHEKELQREEKVDRLQDKVDRLAQERVQEKDEYKYKRYLAKFAGDHKPDLETLKQLDLQFTDERNLEEIKEFLKGEKAAGRYTGNLSPLERERPDPGDTFRILMDYATAKVKTKKAAK